MAHSKKCQRYPILSRLYGILSILYSPILDPSTSTPDANQEGGSMEVGSRPGDSFLHATGRNVQSPSAMTAELREKVLLANGCISL
jgi:hypothetical protein